MKRFCWVLIFMNFKFFMIQRWKWTWRSINNDNNYNFNLTLNTGRFNIWVVRNTHWNYFIPPILSYIIIQWASPTHFKWCHLLQFLHVHKIHSTLKNSNAFILMNFKFKRFPKLFVFIKAQSWRCDDVDARLNLTSKKQQIFNFNVKVITSHRIVKCFVFLVKSSFLSNTKWIKLKLVLHLIKCLCVVRWDKINLCNW